MLHSRSLRLYAVNGKSVELTQGPQTAFGRRIVQLSEAYDEELLDDETVVFYLEELAASCEHQLTKVETIGCTPDCIDEHQRILTFLDGMLDLADDFDQLTHRQITARVKALEEGLTITLCALTVRKAA